LDELEALVRLNHISLLGPIKIRLLMQIYGSAQAALEVPAHELQTIPGFGPKIIEAWKQGLHSSAWEEDLIHVEREKVQLIPFTHADYPKRLLELSDYPLILYVKGSLQKEDQRGISVIGTRQATYYGLEMAKIFSRDLASAGWSIVSGLARGIDTAAHQGALEKGRTLAVLGSGLSVIYPRENERLAQMIAQQGAVISEFPMRTPPDRSHFPQRNRIVSGLSQALLLIEAPHKSGAMLTVSKALQQDRVVFALPGRVDQENFKGNHALIKERKAQLVEQAQDILNVIDPQAFTFNFQKVSALQIILDKEEEQLMQLLPAGEELSIEQIVNRLQWPVAQLNVLLISLVLKKAIKEYPGKIYKKV